MALGMGKNSVSQLTKKLEVRQIIRCVGLDLRQNTLHDDNSLDVLLHDIRFLRNCQMVKYSIQ